MKRREIMRIAKISITPVILFFFVACSMNESKLKSIVDHEIGRELIIEKARLELEKQLGRKDSKLKSSFLEMLGDKIHISYSDILIEGRRARVKVSAEVPKMECIGALFAEARFISRERILDMTAEELYKEVAKRSRAPASEHELQTEVYEFSIDFEKNKDWVADSEQLKKAYNKKNLVQY